MATNTLSAEERIGLVAAVALHAALAAALLAHPPAPRAIPTPERIAVTISDDVGLTATAPEPAAQPAPDVAPQLGEAQPAAPEPAPAIEPQPVARAASLAPTPLAVSKPVPSPAAVRRSVAEPARVKPTPERSAARSQTDTAVPKRGTVGGSRVGNDFLKGVSATSAEHGGAAATAIGPEVRSSLSSAITHQLKPYWATPQGGDAEKLVTVLAFDLNPDGSLRGRPRVVRQLGITDVNRAQADRHAEQAIRAVVLAAPFDLPAKYYSVWKRVASFRFDKGLSK